MDITMPGRSGIEGMPAVLQAVPAAKVLILSMQDDPRYVLTGNLENFLDFGVN
jgi:DNA-binding NarL/FixJ family response regulator